MKVFKQESTQRTSKAFKQHTFAVLFDHSVFWQGAPIPQKMGIKSSLSVGLGESLPQAILPNDQHPLQCTIFREGKNSLVKVVVMTL